MRTPLDLEFQVMWSDPAFPPFIADALIYETLHTVNELGGRQSTLWLDRAAELSIDDIAHAFKDTSQKSLWQGFFAFLPRRL